MPRNRPHVLRLCQTAVWPNTCSLKAPNRMSAFIEIIKSLSWQHTVPVAVVVAVWILRRQLGDLVGRLKQVSGEGKKYSLLFDLPSQKDARALPTAGEEIIKRDDVVEAFRAIPDFSEQEVKAGIDRIYDCLLRNGIVTKKQLYDLVSSAPILNTIRRVYVDVLKRPRDKTLDPLAVAVWGGMLFSYGVKDEIVSAIILQLKNSQEYKQKHLSTANPAQPSGSS